MPDYERMYFALFHSVADAIELLEAAQLSAEECYISQAENSAESTPLFPAEIRKSQCNG